MFYLYHVITWCIANEKYNADRILCISKVLPLIHTGRYKTLNQFCLVFDLRVLVVVVFPFS